MPMSDAHPIRIPPKRRPLTLAATGVGVGIMGSVVDVFGSHSTLWTAFNLFMTVAFAAVLGLVVRALRRPLVTFDLQGMRLDLLFDRWNVRWSDIRAVRKRRVLWIRNIEVVPHSPPSRPWFQLVGPRRYLIPLWALPVVPGELLSEMRARAGPNTFEIDAD
jgi:hypothetical protein